MISFFSGILVAVLGFRLVLLVTWGRETLYPMLEERSYAVTNSSSELGPSTFSAFSSTSPPSWALQTLCLVAGIKMHLKDPKGECYGGARWVRERSDLPQGFPEAK